MSKRGDCPFLKRVTGFYGKNHLAAHYSCHLVSNEPLECLTRLFIENGWVGGLSRFVDSAECKLHFETKDRFGKRPDTKSLIDTFPCDRKIVCS